MQSHWGERQLHAAFTSAHLGCCWEPITAPLIFDQSRHENTLCSSHFCLGVSQVSVHIFTCRCVFVISLPLFLHLFLTDKLQADWIGYTLLFFLHHPTPALFLYLPLVPLCNGTKALLGMAWHLLAHFVSSSFYVESFEKSFELDFYFFINFYYFLGYPKEYWFDITLKNSLLLFSFFCWVLPQPQATTEQQAEQHVQTALTYPCLSSKYGGK